ncbi:MAG: OmpA family protein [Silvanigrellales bacterium]|jgi:flagellar motor protein MotB|nr:OmpA family protein [Silvanigrellales bacterium]
MAHSDDDDDGGGHGGGGGHESDEHLWLYSFNDMLFNLLLFFIVMFAISSVNKSKFAAVAEAMRLPGGVKTQGKPIWFEKRNTQTEDVASGTIVQCAGPVLPPAVAAPAAAPAAARGEPPPTSSKERVLDPGALFSAGGAELSPGGERLLRELAKELTSPEARKALTRIEVEAWERPAPKPAVREAWTLSALRTARVSSYLVESGVEAGLLSARARGPAAREPGAGAKVIVRRVERVATPR